MQKLKLIEGVEFPEDGILRHSDVEAVRFSDRVLRDLAVWLDETRVEHENEIRRQKEEARRVAYQEGLAAFLEGRDLYLTAAKDLEDRLAGLLKTSLQKIFGEIPNADIIEATLVPLLREIHDDGDISIAVHPDRVEQVRLVIEKQEMPIGTFTILGNSEFDISDCMIYSDSSVIDIGVRVIVDQLVDALAGPQIKLKLKTEEAANA